MAVLLGGIGATKKKFYRAFLYKSPTELANKESKGSISGKTLKEIKTGAVNLLFNKNSYAVEIMKYDFEKNGYDHIKTIYAKNYNK